jgi:ribosomal protein S12 methylthiotransferase
MYTNPDFWNEKILELYNKYDELCRYIDIPVQHASDRILTLMNRKKNSGSIRAIIKNIRKNVPDIAIRTSIITGFPSESEEEFSELMDFVEEMKFERLGVFTYSEEEDTEAAKLKDDVPEEEKERRQELLMETQFDIGAAFAREKIGSEVEVLIEKKDNDQYVGRTMWDAPEVDCFALIRSERELKIGEFYKMKVSNNSGLDLIGKIN